VTEPRGPTLDVLLDLDGQVLVVDPKGYRVQFVVTRVPVSPGKPHGIDYSLTLHGLTARAWSDSTTRIQLAGKSVARRKTIVTGCRPLCPMSTGTRQPCSPISGKWWTLCCARKE